MFLNYSVPEIKKDPASDKSVSLIYSGVACCKFLAIHPAIDVIIPFLFKVGEVLIKLYDHFRACSCTF